MLSPKHCHYTKATNDRSDSFTIDKHPLLPDGVRSVKTDGSKFFTTSEKFDQLLDILKILKNDDKINLLKDYRENIATKIAARRKLAKSQKKKKLIKKINL